MDNQQLNGCIEASNEEIQEDSSMKTEELLHSMLHVSRLKGKTKDAEIEIAQLLSQLQVASEEAKELALRVEESNAEAMTHKTKLQSLERFCRSKGEHLFNLDGANQCEVLRELGDVKGQLIRLRLDMDSASETKAKAEKEAEDSTTKARLYSSFVEEMKEKIARSMVDETLTNAAQVDADEEFREVEAQREAEAAYFSKSIQQTRIQIHDLNKEMDYAKKLHAKLAIAASDVNVLQNEIELIRALGKSSHTSCSMECGSEKGEQEQSAKAELATAKKELLILKDEGFKLMSEMDAIRKELLQIADQKDQSSNIKGNSDSILELRNHKLHNSKSKLEAASFAEKRADSIVSNLSAGLQQLQADTEAAKRDTEMTCAATKAARTEIEKTKSNVFSMEQRLQVAMEELKAGIAFEDLALMKLRTITESTTSDRAISSLYSSTITISKFEYYYLIKQAKAAQEIANQKVAAAQAWIEASRIKDKAETVHQRRLSISKKGHVHGKPTKNKLNYAHESDKNNVQSPNLKLAIAMPRRSITVRRVSESSKRTRVRRASVSSGRQPTVVSSNTCLASSSRKNMILKLVKFLGGSGSGKQR